MLRAAAVILLFASIARADWAPREGASLIGTPAPELVGLRWLQGGPLTMAKLRGNVVLIRFWGMFGVHVKTGYKSQAIEK